jgi:hypothetical protein
MEIKSSCTQADVKQTKKKIQIYCQEKYLTSHTHYAMYQDTYMSQAQSIEAS